MAKLVVTPVLNISLLRLFLAVFNAAYPGTDIADYEGGDNGGVRPRLTWPAFFRSFFFFSFSRDAGTVEVANWLEQLLWAKFVESDQLA